MAPQAMNRSKPTMSAKPEARQGQVLGTHLGLRPFRPPRRFRKPLKNQQPRGGGHHTRRILASPVAGRVEPKTVKNRQRRPALAKKFSKRRGGDSPGAKSASCWMNWSYALTACRGTIWRSCGRCSWLTSFYHLEPEIWVSAWVSEVLAKLWRNDGR